VYYNKVINYGSATGASVMSYAAAAGGVINFFNNTIYATAAHAGYGRLWEVYGTGYTYKNNIVAQGYAADIMLRTVQNASIPVSDYNQLWVYSAPGGISILNYIAGYYTLAEYISGFTSEVHSYYSDPLFVNVASDWSLQAGSPAVNTGTVISTIPQVDFLGNPIVGVPDIGCYERQ
jgi:hypothetical protein